ncbi:right-handed parallel beta-helix repeat-containing protein, partial [Actinocorallia lasiicapitis]
TGGPARETAGAGPVGSARYTIPARSVFVAASGNDGAAGTVDAPVRTIGKGVALAPEGGTVVVRGGTYHETVKADRTVTIQPYPGEAVWLDGSVAVGGWRAEGGRWVKDGWTAQFDSSPSYTKGAKDGTAAAWTFLNKNYPYAARPDQVFVDGKQLRQVGSAAAVTEGTFFPDYAAQRLYLGTNPAGRDVRATDLADGVHLTAPGSVLRGVGVRRYATSIPGLGTVKVSGRDSTVENVTVTDAATTGVSAVAPRVTLRNVTVVRAGMLGVHGNYADGVQLSGVRAEDNNIEHFNGSPVAGGIKITRTRGVRVTGSYAAGNDGKGLWLDESVYDSTVTGNDFSRNTGHGISWEISAKAVFAGNVITGNGGDGLRVNDSNGAEIWNNTITGNGRTVNLVQDGRRAANLSTAGHDPRQKLPDPTMTWLLGDIRLGNNVLGAPKAGPNCVLCVEDYSHERRAEDMKIAADGNLYHRPDGTPAWLVVWSSGPGNPRTFTTLAAFRSATGQEPHGSSPTGPLQPPTTAQTTATAQPLPSPIASLLGTTPTTRTLGAPQ